MRFPEKEITLKDGRKCILRPTSPDLAEEMIEYLKVTSGETPFLLRYPDEVNYTPEGEKEILGRLLDAPDSAMTGKWRETVPSTASEQSGRSVTAVPWQSPCIRNTGTWASVRP